jgi:phage terminase small subunit
MLFFNFVSVFLELHFFSLKKTLDKLLYICFVLRMENESKKLTTKQIIFCSEYIKDFNATQSAIRAGYSEDTAGAIGSENLTKLEIKEEINRQLEIILADNKDLALKVVRECQKIAFAQMTDFLDYDDDGVILKNSNEVDTSALESIQFDSRTSKDGLNVTKKVKLHDKLKALDILAKYTALYKETLNINANINQPLSVQIVGVDVEEKEVKE